VGRAESKFQDRLRIWIDTDEQDPWLSHVQQLHDTLVSRSVGLEWHIFPGAHGGPYWSAHVGDHLSFCFPPSSATSTCSA
jgi:enterochelin esterase-like enzyme